MSASPPTAFGNDSAQATRLEHIKTIVYADAQQISAHVAQQLRDVPVSRSGGITTEC